MTRYAPKHFVAISFRAEWDAGEPVVMEPDKLESWGWYDIDKLPSPLYAAVLTDIEAYKTGRMYFDDASEEKI